MLDCENTNPITVAGRLRTACAVRLLSLLILSLTASVQAQFNYTNNNGTITITSYTGPGSPGNPGFGGAVIIPSTINGLRVKCIGDNAFALCSVTSVTIPDSVTSIGNDVFDLCQNLTSITIPDSVTSIGSAFSFCIHLPSLIIPASVTSISSNTFGALHEPDSSLFQRGRPKRWF